MGFAIVKRVLRVIQRTAECAKEADDDPTMTAVLAEATLLSMVGGAIGVLVGWLGSRFSFSGIQPEVLPSSVLLASPLRSRRSNILDILASSRRHQDRRLLRGDDHLIRGQALRAHPRAHCAPPGPFGSGEVSVARSRPPPGRRRKGAA